MPKLNRVNLITHLYERLHELERGEEVASRDFKALLSDEQYEDYEQMLKEQERIKITHRTKARAEADGLNWMSKREIRIEIYKTAIKYAVLTIDEALAEEQYERDVRETRIYMDAWSKAKDEGKNAESKAQIAITRAGFGKKWLRKNDGLDKRNAEVNAMEDALRERFRKTMTADELENERQRNEYDLEQTKRKKG